jgi:hypothetical protein
MAGGAYSICTLCINACHADHDVKYIRNGRHFCDCGAEGEKTCFSLVKKQTGKLFFTFSNFSCIFLNLNCNCSNLLDMRNFQEEVKKAFCYQKFL